MPLDAQGRPSSCTVDFSLVPIGTKDTSFSKEIADIQILLQQSGLKFQMHATGTIVEGPWDLVSRVIGDIHTLLHQQGIARIQTDVRVSTRTDKSQPMEGTVASVQKHLSF